MESITILFATLPRLWQKFFPYVIVEIVLPGGTLLALLLYLTKKHDTARRRRSPAVRATAGN